MKRLPEMTDKRKAVAVFTALFLLVAVGLGPRLYGLTNDSDDEPGRGGATSSEPTPEAATPASPTTTTATTSSPAASSSTSSTSVTQKDQDASARAALKSVVPKWASMKYEDVGTDETKWLEGWRDEPAAASSFKDQSKKHFISLFHGVISLEADAKADSLKSVRKVWSEDGQSGWLVKVDRELTNSGGMKETESLEWEFIVDLKNDGTSEVTAFNEPSSTDH